MNQNYIDNFLYPFSTTVPRIDFQSLNNDQVADGKQYIPLRARLIDLLTALPIPNATIHFTVDGSAFFVDNLSNSTLSVTDRNGEAFAAIANNKPEQVIVQAHYGTNSPIIFARFIEQTLYEIIIDTSSSYALANGMEMYRMNGRVLFNRQAVGGLALRYWFTNPVGAEHLVLDNTDSRGEFSYSFSSFIPGEHIIKIEGRTDSNLIVPGPTLPAFFLDSNPYSAYHILFSAQRANGSTIPFSRMIIAIRNVLNNTPPANSPNQLIFEEIWPDPQPVTTRTVSSAPLNTSLPSRFERRATFQITWRENPSTFLIYHNIP